MELQTLTGRCSVFVSVASGAFRIGRYGRVWEAGEGFFLGGGRVGNLPYLFEQRVIYFLGNVGQNLPEPGEYPRARF